MMAAKALAGVAGWLMTFTETGTKQVTARIHRELREDSFLELLSLNPTPHGNA